jgi:3-deoxy-D-manno-octulosonic-acid transferase
MWRRGGYGKDFQHRLGRFRRLDPPAGGKTRIWLQAVSVGEVLAVGPLIEALQKNGRIEIVLTTTTSTGYVEARKRYADRVLSIGIFPLDFWLFARLAWKRIQPDAIILTESELWPEHLHQAKTRAVPAYLVNARMSDTSFKRYKKLPSLVCRLLKKFSAIFAASEHDASRLRQLGVAPERIQSIGSIKIDVPLPDQLDSNLLDQLLKELGFFHSEDRSPLILLGSSTWPGEESALIEIVAALRATGIDLRLLLVPRHAERRAEIISLLEQQALPWHQRSTGIKPTQEIIIHLADTTGELSRLCQAADLAFIGKSLPPNEGGQTPIEAAGLGVPTLMGPNMNNFKALAKSLVRAGAALTVKDVSELKEKVEALIKDHDKRLAMGAAGREWHQKNRGSSQRIADEILAGLGHNAGTGLAHGFIGGDADGGGKVK